MEVGDVVYLKSGSRPMTVINVPPVGANSVQMIDLQWDGGTSLQGGTLPELTLTPDNPAAQIAANSAAVTVNPAPSPPVVKPPA